MFISGTLLYLSSAAYYGRTPNHLSATTDIKDWPKGKEFLFSHAFPHRISRAYVVRFFAIDI